MHDRQAHADQLAFYQEFVRKNLNLENVWSWHSFSFSFDANAHQQAGGFHWAYYLRNSVLQHLAKDSATWQAYCAYLLGLHIDENKMPTLMGKLSAKAKAIDQAKKDKELKRKMEEEEKAKKNQKPAKPAPTKSDPAKKGTDKLAVDKKDAHHESPKQLNDLTKSKLEVGKSMIIPDSSPGRKTRLHAQTDQWKRFEIIHKQMDDLPHSSITAGVILEAYIDEIEATITGDVPIHFQAEEEKKEAALGGLLDSIFAELLTSK